LTPSKTDANIQLKTVFIRSYLFIIMSTLVPLLRLFMLTLVTFGQFHQHFTREFLVRKCFTQLFSTYMQLEKSCWKDFRTKNACIKCWWNWYLFSNVNRDDYFFPFRSIVVVELKCSSHLIEEFIARPQHSLRQWLGEIFINVLWAAFVCADPESAKKNWQLVCLFCAFGICMRKIEIFIHLIVTMVQKLLRGRP